MRVLCDITENRFKKMCKMYSFCLRRLSASSLGNCAERYIRKVILELHTNNESVQLFERTLADGFKCVNTRFGCDSKILLPNLTQTDYKKMNIDQRFQAFKRQSIKQSVRSK